MLMKNIVLYLMALLWTATAVAQPRPYEIDVTYVPTLEYMQKQWTGSYDALEPNSRMILTIDRTMLLKVDYTYTNEVKATIRNEGSEGGESVLLKYEEGTYEYDEETHVVTYTLAMDNTLDINEYLKGNEPVYVTNNYAEDGEVKTNTEDAQFTAPSSDGVRQWVLFDDKLQSPVNPRQKAVYVMVGTELPIEGPDDSETSIQGVKKSDGYSANTVYSLNGRCVSVLGKGIYIINGKKAVLK